MKELILSTHNKHKIVEMKTLFCSLPVPIKSLDDFPPFPPGQEDGMTFEENARKKATWAAGHLYRFCLADDSGLEVEALDARPGIYSARYAKTNPERIARLLEEMKNIPEEKRSARFVCSMALSTPDGKAIIKTGFCYGRIIHEPRGTNGFGYDPVFFLPELGKTMAELDPGEKNQISHRAQAATLILPVIEKIIASHTPL